MKAALLIAATTGLFCAVFAMVIDAVTDVLSMWQAVGLAFLSGFLGSLTARFVLGKRAE